MVIKNGQVESLFVCMREIANKDFDARLVAKIVTNKRRAAAAFDEVLEFQKERNEHYRNLLKEEGNEGKEEEFSQKLIEELQAFAEQEADLSITPFKSEEIYSAGVKLKPNQMDFLDEIGVVPLPE